MKPAAERPPAHLEMLHFPRRLTQQHLAQLDNWTAEEERRQVEGARGEAARPPAPDWLVESDLVDRPSRIHAGDCFTRGKRSCGIDRTGALHALTQGALTCPAVPPRHPPRSPGLNLSKGTVIRCR
ncbi:hypothetical protein ACFV3R_31060 [Streptomyces sp. NPDC059740]|uniref:hypothetical protein n=1 Tax=Streptomyces sp. NPDC059740 TaxID=3346926 RepID=UPI003649CEB8